MFTPGFYRPCRRRCISARGPVFRPRRPYSRNARRAEGQVSQRLTDTTDISGRFGAARTVCIPTDPGGKVGTEQPSQTSPIRRKRLLLHGESAIASAGIALAALLLTLMAGLAWWTVRSERRAAEVARVEQVNSIAFVLGQSAEVMMAGDELSALRRLV